MHTAGHPYPLMTDPEARLIQDSALHILSEMGMEIQSQRLLKVMAEAGLPVNFQTERVWFPIPFMEDFIAQAEKHDWETSQPEVSASAGVYHSLYHDPATDQLVPWSEEKLAFYCALARQMPFVGTASMLGSRIPGTGWLEPLYERYYSWKHGAQEGSSIWLDELCPYLLELYQARASDVQQPVEDIFQGTVYLVPALKLGKHEAYQVAYFRDHNLQVQIGGSMLTMGASAPVTLAGAVTLNLAEQLALRILDWALFGKRQLLINASIAVMDMRTTIRPFGRPEMVMANLMTAQIARKLGAAFSGHAGLTDSKLPSVESGAQKALSAVPTLMAGGNVWVDAGLLGIDEVCSPIQLILDNELLSALTQFTKDYEISADTVGLGTILEAGPGGQYLDQRHTAGHFRQEHWNPAIWSRQMLRSWIDEGSKLDVDKAREIAWEVQNHFQPYEGLSPTLEKELTKIIEKAREAVDESNISS